MIGIDVLYLIGFGIMSMLQSIFINGVRASMEDGMILNGFRKWAMSKSEFLGKPLGGCVKCMSSFYGGLTYWPLVLYLFGFQWAEVPIFVADVFCLTFLNFFFYKKV